MFYAHFVLAKKGPLARIWLAAHWEGKLTKAHVFETNIEKSVDGILQPKVKMALRTTGHLLLGVVRIYSRKAKYLLADCNEAFVKIKMAFRPGMVDLPEEHREANVNAITLPEVFHDFDTAMPELNDVDIEAQFSLNQTRAEDITMREDYGNINLVVTNDEGFGDMSFDTEPSEIMKTASTLEPQVDEAHLLFSDGIPEDQMNVGKDKEPQPSTSGSQARPALEIDAPIRDDGFGGNLGQDIIAGGLFEDGFFDDAPMPSEIPPVENPMVEHRKPSMEQDDMDDDMGDHYGDTGSMGGHSIDGDSCPSTPAQALILEPPPSEPQLMPPSEQPYSDHLEEHIGSMSNDQTTLLQNEAESFALAPVDISTLKGVVKPRRKRKLIVDEVKNISGEEMKAQLSDTTDIVTTLDLAPPTKRLMHWKETGGVEKLFAVPGRAGFAKALFRLYQRHLTSRNTEMCDTPAVGDVTEEELTLEQIKDPDSDLPHIRITRKRKLVEIEEALPQQEQLDMQHLMLPTPQPYVLPDMSNVVPPPPPPATPQGYLPPTTPQPEVPDMSTIDPVHLASMVPTSVVVPPPTPNIPMPQSVPPQLNLDVEMPLLPPDQVHSILDQTEHLPAPPVTEQVPPLQPPQEEHPANMENMGYDANNPTMANMGYDGQAATSQAGEKGAGTPWNEDYEFPASVGPPEEQQTDETYEQFEERVLNKRAGQMYHIVKNKLLRSEQLYLSEMTQRNNRKQAAQKFYTLLVLKKHVVLELTQEHSYDDIMITRGNKFDNPSL